MRLTIGPKDLDNILHVTLNMPRSRPVQTTPAAWASLDSILKEVSDPQLRERLRMAITELERSTEASAAGRHARLDALMDDVNLRTKKAQVAEEKLREIPLGILEEVKYPRHSTSNDVIGVMESMLEEGAVLRYLRRRPGGPEIIGNGHIMRRGRAIREVKSMTIRGILLRYGWIDATVAPDDEHWWEARLNNHGKIALYGLQAGRKALIHPAEQSIRPGLN